MTYSRARVRRIASTISHAWCARSVRPRPTWAAARATSAPTARRWLRLEMPCRRGSSPARTGSAGGTITEARTNAVHRPAETDGSVQAATSVASVSGADMRPAQVVDHLPAGDAGHGAPAPPARGVAGPAKDPGQELPVAPRPAVLAGRRDQVVRREFIEELDIGHQPGPGEDALEQVVAQERVLGYPVRHRRARRRRGRRSPCR